MMTSPSRKSERKNKGIPPTRFGQTASHDEEEPDRQSRSALESDRHQDLDQTDKLDDHELTLINAKASILDEMDPIKKRESQIYDVDGNVDMFKPLFHSTTTETARSRQQVDKFAATTKGKVNKPPLEDKQKDKQRLIDFEDEATNYKNETVIRKQERKNNCTGSVISKDTRGSKRSRRSLEGKLKLLEEEKRLKEKELEIEKARLELEKDYLRKKIELESECGSGSDGDESAYDEKVGRWSDEKIPEEEVGNDKQTSLEISGIDKLADALGEALARNVKQTSKAVSLNKFKDLPFFNGNPEDWPNFYAQFKRTTEEYNIKPSENINRLEKALKGKAKEAVHAMLVVPENLSKVIATLQKRFGRPEYIIKTLLDKVRQLSSFREGQHESFLDFNDVIQNLIVTIENLNEMEFLYNPELMKVIIQKLPINLQFDWAKREKEIERNSGKAKLDDLAMWLDDLADATVRIYAPKVTSLKYKRPFEATRRHESLYLHSTNSYDKSKDRKLCSLCEKPHGLENCPIFLEKSVDERWKIVTEKKYCFSCLKGRHVVRRCTHRQRCSVNNCEKAHNKLLHKDEMEKLSDPKEKNEESTEVCTFHTMPNKTLLKVLLISVKGPTKEMTVAALLDEASTATLIDEDLANELDLPGPTRKLKLRWTNHIENEYDTSRAVRLLVGKVNSNERHEIKNARTVKDLGLPTQNYDLGTLQKKWKYLQNIELYPVANEKPRILIGQDNCHLILPREVRMGGKNEPCATRTSLGWVLHGNVRYCTDFAESEYVNCHIQSRDTELNELLRKNFECDTSEDSEERITKIIDRSYKLMEETSRLIDNRWEIGLLWKDESTKLPNNKVEALRRLRSVEKMMDKDSNFAQKYCDQIQAYLEKGYAKKLSEEEKRKEHDRIWYLPHFSVKHPQKPEKFRFVFDASAKYKGTSLNDNLEPGPDLLNPIVKVLFKFRQHRIAFCGDIEEMFLRIKIREQDQDALRFLWRGLDRENPPEEYCMSSMIFGAACSPASAIFITRKNATTFKTEFPHVEEAVTHQLYMDDFIDSCEKIEDAAKMVQGVIKVHEFGGFNMRNWITNSKELLRYIPEEKQSKNMKDFALGKESTERVLGLSWNYQTDNFIFNLKFAKVDPNVISGQKLPTKREILRTIMSPFDPLGFLTPTTMRGKIIMQELWKSQGDWDDILPGELKIKWDQYLKEIAKAKEIKVPRHYGTLFERRAKIEVHTFCDASFKGYATVSFFRVSLDDKISVSFIMAKSRVAPIKPTTIPRLELRGANLGSELASYVEKNHTITIHSKTFWTDSSIIYYWIQANPRKNKTFTVFVRNRLEKILQQSKSSEWRWIPTDYNPADVATRDVGQVTNSWLAGPEFLRSKENLWPIEILKIPKIEELAADAETIFVTHVGQSGKDEVPIMDVKKYESYKDLIIAMIKKFYENEEISTERWNKAEEILIKQTQKRAFTSEIEHLKKNRPIPKSSPLFQLSPFLDENGVIRMDGRITYAPEVGEETKRPIILPYKEKLTELIVKHYHEKNLHQGRGFTLSQVRKLFWPIHGGALARKVCTQCVICREARPKPKVPEEGQLPLCRMAVKERPFTHTGLDYFGPMLVKIGRRQEKRWGALFTCLTIRAVHLELASSLSTDSAILAVRRFMSRRGEPSFIYSDHGTNFEGADNELQREISQIDQRKIETELTMKNVTYVKVTKWKFIPPGSPHMGGAWESLVKSVKSSLKVTLKEQVLKEETLQTVLCEVEHVINSRPLTDVSADAKDLSPLTPNDLLLGPREVVTVPWSYIQDEKVIKRQWKLSQILADRFWKRWLLEYLPTLTKRNKWFKPVKPIQIGDRVVVIDDNAPRGFWPKGVITATFPGKDKQVRVVEIKTDGGSVLRRPVAKVAVIIPHRPGEDVLE